MKWWDKKCVKVGVLDDSLYGALDGSFGDSLDGSFVYYM